MLKETHNQVVWGRNPRHAAPQADKFRRIPTRRGNRLLPGRLRPARSLYEATKAARREPGLGPMRPVGSRGRQDAGSVSEGVLPARSLAGAPGGGCRSRRRPRGGAEGNRLRAIRRNGNSSRFSPRIGEARSPGKALQFGLASARWRRIRGCIVGGIRGVAHPCGKVSAEQVVRSGIPIGERSSRPRRYRPRPATAPGGPCRLQGMRSSHECSGNRHYPCGSRFANEEGRRSDEP